VQDRGAAAVIDAVADALRSSSRVCVLTGAGISAESGVPTFREARTGLWENYDPAELATPEAFLRDPDLVWRWYRWRRELVAAARPNPGHLALARLAHLVPELTLVTQNVDGLHQRGGSSDVIEFHGNLFEDRCFAEGCSVETPATSGVPHCPGCGSKIRPGVVWFGEAIPEQVLEASFAAAAGCDVFLCVGTSSLVYPAAGLADIAARNDAIVVEINPNPSGRNEIFDLVVVAAAGKALPRIIDTM
jgi:NAD-dependent deacetylase